MNRSQCRSVISADPGCERVSAQGRRAITVENIHAIPTTLDGGGLKNVTYIFHMFKMQVLEILHLPPLST